jgi:hypothetical protein
MAINIVSFLFLSLYSMFSCHIEIDLVYIDLHSAGAAMGTEEARRSIASSPLSNTLLAFRSSRDGGVGSRIAGEVFW